MNMVDNEDYSDSLKNLFQETSVNIQLYLTNHNLYKTE